MTKNMRSQSQGQRPRWVIPSVVGLAVIIGFLLPVYMLLGARAEGVSGFPLDDTWIHLTYARNLWAHHTFAYFPQDPSTAGSTSPIYTLLLSLGFGLSDNEKGLAQLTSLTFHLAFLIALGAWAVRRLASGVWAAAVVLLVALDGRIGILAVSGMETSLFMLAVALSLYGRAAGRPVTMGLAAGLAVWVRPDGLILLCVLLVDLALDRWWVNRAEKNDSEEVSARRWIFAGACCAGLVLLYVIFNMVIGGSALPNTYAAKTAYYAPASTLVFLKQHVMESVASDGWVLLLPFFVGAIVRELYLLILRRPGRARAEVGWAVGLILAYVVLLPFSHLFNRYLIPALPALAVLGAAGLRDLAARLCPGRVFRASALPALAALALLGVIGFWQIRKLAVHDIVQAYIQCCRSHQILHESTGRWLAENTPSDAVIATHDVGAIAFYSGRKVVDIVGVVLPEAVAYLHKPQYVSYLEELFAREGVTHLAVLPSWMEVDNDHPIIVFSPEPERMEVYRWQPGKTHLVAWEAARLKDQALQLMRNQDPASADLLRQAITIDPRSSRLWFMLGAVMEKTGHPIQAREAYQHALSLFPQFGEARAALDRFAQVAPVPAPAPVPGQR